VSSLSELYTLPLELHVISGVRRVHHLLLIKCCLFIGKLGNWFAICMAILSSSLVGWLIHISHIFPCN
jgi:hypothetical protein